MEMPVASSPCAHVRAVEGISFKTTIKRVLWIKTPAKQNGLCWDDLCHVGGIEARKMSEWFSKNVWVWFKVQVNTEAFNFK